MNVTVIVMVYRSLSYLRFVQRHLRLRCRCAEHLIVCNDATPDILQAVKDDYENFLDYRDPKPNDYYLNRVYRAWNAGAREVKTDLIVFLNSDQWGAPGWLENLLQHYDEKTIPCSRLVESGKMPSGKHGISKDFGRTPDTFRTEEFERSASEISRDGVEDGGLYMPCCFNRNEFLDLGGYPEGNICENGIGAFPSRVLRSGDEFFFNETMRHRRQITVMDSIVYHFQNGEMDGD